MRNLKKVLSLVLAMAMMLSVMVVGAGATSLADYSDNDKVSAEYAVAVDVATQLGILEGVGANKYNPQGNLTRAQLATMTYRITTADVTDVYTANFAGGAAENFTDTPADAWYAGYVGYAADAGYLKGVGDDLYKPNSYLTGYQALAAFLRAIGYNEPGQFTGADWTVQVAKVANQIGALEGIKGVDLNAAISREVAAQIIYNILFSNMVEYTPAFGYQDLAGLYGTLAENEFDIESPKGGEDTNVAPWGRPATVWNDKDDDAVVTIMAEPVAEYTVAVTECQLAKDLGLKKDVKAADITKEYVNGTTSSVDVVTGDINLIDTKTEIGAQGTLTEVYLVDEDYQFVQIETWLGQIDKVTEAKFDKAGHEKSPATVDVNVYAAKTPTLVKGVEYTGFAEDDYVLINYSDWQEDGKDIGYFLTKTAPAATATQTYINTVEKYSVIGGTTYDWAAKYFMGNYGAVDTEYDVFVDEYNNVIGIVEPAEADPEYTIFESGIAVTNGYNPYVAGKVVDLATGDLKDIEVCSYDQFSAWTDDEITYVHAIVAYEECEDGYEMTYAGTAYNDYSIVKGTPRIVAGDVTLVTDSETVYAVETECGEYDIYTGYANVPTMTSTGNGVIEVLDDDKDGYIDLVYVDASDALFAGDDSFAYIMTSCKGTGAGVLANDVKYDTYTNVVVNGEVVELKVEDGFDLDAAANLGKAVTLKTNSDGLVCAVEAVEGFTPYAVYAENHDEVIFVTNTEGADKSYVVTADTIIWVVNEIDNWATVGTADDVVPGYDAAIKVAENGTDAEIVIVWDKEAE